MKTLAFLPVLATACLLLPACDKKADEPRPSSGPGPSSIPTNDAKRGLPVTGTPLPGPGGNGPVAKSPDGRQFSTSTNAGSGKVDKEPTPDPGLKPSATGNP